MSAQLKIRIDRGGMIRKGALNKSFFIVLDGNSLGTIDWGDKRSYTIPAGKHTLTLKYRPIEMWWCLELSANAGETAEVDSTMDMKTGHFTLINKADGTTSDDHPARPSLEYMQSLAKKTKESWLRRIVIGIPIGISAAMGGFLVFLWHNITGSTDSGVTLFFMIFLGSLLGGAVCAGILALFRKL